MDKLKKKKYRDAFVREHVRTGIAYQIRTIREGRPWTQAQLGRAAKKPQNVISRLEDPDYGKLNVQTLFEIASAFDVGLLVKFVPFSRLVTEYDDVSPSKLVVSDFADDLTKLERWARAQSEEMVGRIIPNAVLENRALNPQLGSVHNTQLKKRYQGDFADLQQLVTPMLLARAGSAESAGAGSQMQERAHGTFERHPS